MNLEDYLARRGLRLTKRGERALIGTYLAALVLCAGLVGGVELGTL